MAVTPSSMLELGTTMPAFSLPDFDGRLVADRDFAAAPGVLVAFICHHCPYVAHIRAAFSKFAAEYEARGLAIVAINSNDVIQYPEDGPEGMKAEAKGADYTFPYLYDESQDVARAFHAACTPDFFLFDKAKRLVYRGQFDESRPNSSVPVTGKALRTAADAVLAGQAPASEQRPSLGCNIKWKP